MGVKLYTRRDLAKLLSIGIAGTALDSQGVITRSALALRGAMMGGGKKKTPFVQKRSANSSRVYFPVNSGYVVEFCFSKAPGTTRQIPGGCAGSNSYFIFITDNKINGTTTTIEDNVPYVYRHTNNGIFLDGAKVSNGYLRATDYSVFSTTGFGGSYAFGKVYWIKAWDESGRLVNDIVPNRENLFVDRAGGQFTIFNDPASILVYGEE